VEWGSGAAALGTADTAGVDVRVLEFGHVGDCSAVGRELIELRRH